MKPKTFFDYNDFEAEIVQRVSGLRPVIEDMVLELEFGELTRNSILRPDGWLNFDCHYFNKLRPSYGSELVDQLIAAIQDIIATYSTDGSLRVHYNP